MTRRIAVVGAGAAGAATAYALRDDEADVTLFERSDEVGGRAATRHHRGCTYEYGANYLPGDDDCVNGIVTNELPDDGLAELTDPVWTFDESGTVSRGRSDQGHRWTYENGIVELGRRLVAASDATLHRETTVETLVRNDERWRLVDADGEPWGPFDALVVTPPAPTTADLLAGAKWDHADRDRLAAAVGGVSYRTVLAAVLHYPFEVDAPYYALVAEDDGHEVGWIGREECKPGHVPSGESLLLVQMAPEWSVERYGDPLEELTAAAAEGAAALLDDERLRDPDWTDHQHWRDALPDGSPPAETPDRAASHDLYFAGDWVAGEARLYAAVRSGLETGERLSERSR